MYVDAEEIQSNMDAITELEQLSLDEIVYIEIWEENERKLLNINYNIWLEERAFIEKHPFALQNIDTGLVRPYKDPAGKNQAVYICLKKINNDFPKCIMSVINDFLNWIPAGCWRDTGRYGVCEVCNFKYRDVGLSKIGLNVCSLGCMEREYRSYITNDCENVWNVMINKFKKGCSIEELINYFSSNRVYVEFCTTLWNHEKIIEIKMEDLKRKPANKYVTDGDVYILHPYGCECEDCKKYKPKWVFPDDDGY